MTITAAVIEAPDNVAGRIMGINQDVPWTEGGGLSEVQSYKWIVVDAIYARIKAMSLFRGWTIRRIAAQPIEAGIQIPFIGIYEDEEIYDGGNSYGLGAVGFKFTLNVGIQIVVKNNDRDLCLQTLDRHEWYLMNQLLRDNSLTNMWQEGLRKRAASGYARPVQIEGFKHMRRRESLGNTIGTKNETAIGQGIIKFAIPLGVVDFYPTEFPDLHRIAIQTGFPIGGDADDRAGVQQAVVTYDFKPDTGEWIENPMPDDTQSPLPFPPM